VSADARFKYVKVADALRGRIESGELPEGAKLVMRRLAREYGVGPRVVCAALSSLGRENLVFLDQRDGWHVKARPAPYVPPRAPRLGASEGSGGVSDSGTAPPVNLLSLLDLEQGASLLTCADESAGRVARELCPPDATLAQRIALYELLHKVASEVRWPSR
jgi:DNA-binding GntR family transcriptional regulator